MTVVVVRNNIIAVDRRMCNGPVHATTNKLYTLDGTPSNLVLRPVRSSERVWIGLAFTGDLNVGIELMHWYARGADIKDYPAIQNTDSWCRLIVAMKDNVRSWEKGSAYPITAVGDYCAFGSGMQFAYGALAAGAQAVTAVGCTAQHCADVGGGVDYVTLVDGEEHGTQANTGG